MRRAASDAAVRKQLPSPYAPTKTVLVDFDGTIMPFSWPNKPRMPFPGAVEAINWLYDNGYYVVIFTARVWSGWDRVDPEGKHNTKNARAAVAAYCQNHNIPYHEISSEKRPCLFIIDDSAIPAGPKFDWKRLPALIKRGNANRMVVTGREE
jgi:hypothetical protein